MPKDCRPSPARYALPTTVGFNGHDIRKNRLPAYTFGLRPHDLKKAASPAPNAYGLPSIIGGRDVSKEKAPAHTMHAKLPQKDHSRSPAPNTYSLQNFKPGQRAPAYSMAERLKDLAETKEC